MACAVIALTDRVQVKKHAAVGKKWKSLANEPKNLTIWQVLTPSFLSQR